MTGNGSDPYGYAARRLAVAQRLGKSYATMLKEWPDERIRAEIAQHESAGLPVIPQVLFGNCAACGDASHLTEQEQAIAAALCNEVWFVMLHGASGGAEFCRRPDVTNSQEEAVWGEIDRVGDINHERCLLLRAGVLS